MLHGLSFDQPEFISGFVASVKNNRVSTLANCKYSQEEMKKENQNEKHREGCTSFFCMGVAPPRMGGSRTASDSRASCARRCSEAFSLGRRSRHVVCLELRASNREEKVQKKLLDLLPLLLILFLLTGHTLIPACEESLTGGLLHGFLPAVIADPGA
jgi:hypothetical protein